MKYYFQLLCLTMGYFVQGQTVHLFTKAEGKHINLMATNLEYCPISIELELDLNNMTSSLKEQKRFVIPAQIQEYKILEIHPIDPYSTYKFGYSYSSNYGDHSKESYDTDYEYWLPFASSASYPLHQGYHGRFSHQDMLALDFSMPEGSPVHAAREGIVIKVVDHHHKRCEDASCAKFNNLILVYHSDGSFAEYVHLQKGGAMVQVGDTIEKGQAIGRSGNTGWSNGPHLHFAVFKQKMQAREGIPTQFKVGTGEDILSLEEGKVYTRAY